MMGEVDDILKSMNFLIGSDSIPTALELGDG